jgi:dTDP-4-amino-4,6-dideoxygalactose transaminase
MRQAEGPVRVSGSDIGIRELLRVGVVFERGYLGMGADVKEFEVLLADFLSRQVACTATGTAALQLAVQAANIGPGDEVLVPSLTYVASFQAISATGARPIPVDVLESSLTVDPADAERRTTSRTKAIMPVYYGGGIRERSSIRNFARSRDLRVIEDAAHAFGSYIDGSLVGSDGDISCFSFDPIKNLTSGEGGCVVSDDEEVMSRVRDARLLGVLGDSQARHNERRLYEFEVEEQGWRYHMSNICAAIGIAQFEKFDATARRRRELARIYNEAFHGVDGLSILPYTYADDEVVPHIYVVRFKDRDTRERIKERLLEKCNVETALHWYPNHYLARFKQEELSLPVTEDAFDRMLTLPLHTKLSNDQVSMIADFVTSELAGV